MITITLQKIKNAGPCREGWEKLLKSKGGIKAEFSAEFPLTDLLDSNSLDDLLWCLRCLPEHNNIWRKYAVWCARQVEHLMADQRSKDALDAAWNHSEGLITNRDLAAAWDAARAAAWAAAGDAARDAQKSKIIEVLNAGRWI